MVQGGVFPGEPTNRTLLAINTGPPVGTFSLLSQFFHGGLTYLFDIVNPLLRLTDRIGYEADSTWDTGSRVSGNSRIGELDWPVYPSPGSRF